MPRKMYGSFLLLCGWFNFERWRGLDKAASCSLGELCQASDILQFLEQFHCRDTKPYLNGQNSSLLWTNKSK